MGLTRMGENQELGRHATLVLPLFGEIPLLSIGDIPNAVSTTTLNTGEIRTTGQLQTAEVPIGVPWENREDVAKIELWHAMCVAGLPGHIQRGGHVRYDKQDGTPGAIVELESAQLDTKTHPGTDASGAGNETVFTANMLVFNGNKLPGT